MNGGNLSTNGYIIILMYIAVGVLHLSYILNIIIV